MKQTKTELHTHLIGILSANEFVDFIKKLKINEIIIDDKIIPTEKLLEEPFYSMIQIKNGESVNYSRMNSYYANRTEILKYIVNKYYEKYGISKSKLNIYIYNELINASLKSLIKNGVEYVEISYSFFDRISKFVIAEDISNKIKCRFLLSTDRSNPLHSEETGVQTFEKATKDLSKAMKSGNCVGFDIMGEERKLSQSELNYNSNDSFMRKLELLINVLKNGDSTLRIHSGETNNSFINTITILKMIDDISARFNIVIPPPEIRIGHGLYFDNNHEYIYLLKKFKCIIEINASSNLLLGNVENIDSIPYRFYIQNDIPIVISTDGHGLYNTNTKKEDKIAFSVLQNEELYDRIIQTDTEIIGKKGR